MAADVPNPLIRSVYFGDVVTITPEGSIFVGRSAWWSYVVAIGGTGIVAVLAFVIRWDRAEALFWPVVVVSAVFLAVEVVRCFRSGRVRRRLDAIELTPSDNPRSLAWRLWQRALVDRRGKFVFNAGAWLDGVMPDGPRVISLNVHLPDIPAPTEASEEVLIGLDGPIGTEERARRWLQLGLYGFNFILLCVLTRTATTGGFFRLWMGVTWAVFIAIALYRLGVRPISLGASTAAPGLVRTTRGTTTREFTRGDSVLVLQGARSIAVAWLFRRDGASARLHFHSGDADPGLRLLIERWCLPAFRREESTKIGR